MKNKKIRMVLSNILKLRVLAKSIRFAQLCRLNLFFLPKLEKYDISIIKQLNKIDSKLLGDWMESLPRQSKVVLLNMVLDPRSVGLLSDRYPYTMRNTVHIKYNMEDRDSTIHHHSTHLDKLDGLLSNLKAKIEMQEHSRKNDAEKIVIQSKNADRILADAPEKISDKNISILEIANEFKNCTNADTELTTADVKITKE